MGQGLGKGEHVGLCGVIGRHERAGLEGSRGGDVQDASLTPLDHAGKEETGQRCHRGHIDLDLVHLSLNREGVESAGGAKTGVVDQHIDGRPFQRGGDRGGGSRVGQVRDQGAHLDATGLPQLGGQPVQVFGAPGHEDQVGAVRCEQVGQLQAEAAGSAGDEGGLSLGHDNSGRPSVAWERRIGWFLDLRVGPWHMGAPWTP